MSVENVAAIRAKRLTVKSTTTKGSDDVRREDIISRERHRRRAPSQPPSTKRVFLFPRRHLLENIKAQVNQEPSS
jgi:hypothetical protein